MRAFDYIQQLQTQGTYHFTVVEAQHALDRSIVATRASLRRLRDKGVVASPLRGFFIIVPPEYKSLGSLPPEQFVPAMMRYLGEPYYVALLSAAQLYGAAHQQPQTFQVMASMNRSPVQCGRVRVEFVAKKNLEETPTETMKTPRGPVLVSTPEATALDLVGYSSRAGGLDAVATVLEELGEVIHAEKLGQAARSSPTAWSQRLGYLLSMLGYQELAEGLAGFVQAHATVVAPLDPSLSITEAPRESQWKLAVNTEVSPDL